MLKHFRIKGAIAFLTTLLIISFATPLLSQTTTEQATVVIDFSNAAAPATSQSGFLYGISGTNPSNTTINPLQPKLWRTSQLDLYNRIRGLGSEFQLILSDTWGYGAPRGWPYQNYQAWEDHVRAIARQNKDKTIIWDIWNEPDLANPFWAGTREQFFETYKRAYQVLRQELGTSAIIGGPSLAQYSQEYIAAFLEFCLQNGLEVNFLSWHELNDYEITGISDRIAFAKQNWQRNPRYQPLKIQKIYTNEIVGPLAQYQPGDILGYLAETEQGSNGSAKACWEPIAGGVNNCFNEALDGLVAPGTNTRRSAWWVYKSYSDGVSQRIPTQSNNVRVPALASRNGQVLVGFMTSGITNPKATITLDFRNINAIAPNQPLKIKIYRIPNSGEASMESLPLISDIPIPTLVTSFKRTIQGVNLHEAYLVTISP